MRWRICIVLFHHPLFLDVFCSFILHLIANNDIFTKPQVIWINQQVITQKRIKSSKNVLTDSCG